MLIRKERSYLFFTDHVARLFLQDWDVLVSFRIYRRGYGRIMALLADDKRSDEECIRIQKEIDEYMKICYMLDCNHVKMNHGARLGIEVRYGWKVLITLVLATAFYVRAMMSDTVLNLILAFMCMIFAVYIEAQKNYRVRNCVVDDEYIEDIIQNGRLMNPDDTKRPPIYAYGGRSVFRKR